MVHAHCHSVCYGSYDIISSHVMGIWSVGANRVKYQYTNILSVTCDPLVVKVGKRNFKVTQSIFVALMLFCIILKKMSLKLLKKYLKGY